jgi:DNA-binding MurR/RpiR family transcriptional regulator
LYEKLEKNRKSLNENEEKILQYLLNNKMQLSNLTVREISNHFYTVPNTIIRMCKKLGFSGFQQFKDEVELSLKIEKVVGEITSLDDMIVKTKQIINKEVLDEIIESIHGAKNILFFGVGLSRFPAAEFSERLKIFGKKTHTFIDPHVMIYNAELMTTDDIAIAISLSGREDSNVYKATSRAKTVGACTVSITGFSANPLANLTDKQLYGYSSSLRIKGIDAADRFSLHYITNLLFNEYINKYHNINTEK